MPLPNFEIIKLQWLLHRVCAAGYHDETEVEEPVVMSDGEEELSEEIIDIPVKHHLECEGHAMPSFFLYSENNIIWIQVNFISGRFKYTLSS
jgi:hypothetical protein